MNKKIIIIPTIILIASFLTSKIFDINFYLALIVVFLIYAIFKFQSVMNKISYNKSGLSRDEKTMSNNFRIALLNNRFSFEDCATMATTHIYQIACEKCNVEVLNNQGRFKTQTDIISSTIKAAEHAVIINALRKAIEGIRPLLISSSNDEEAFDKIIYELVAEAVRMANNIKK